MGICTGPYKSLASPENGWKERLFKTQGQERWRIFIQINPLQGLRAFFFYQEARQLH
jgi:hypothetical protein